MDINPASGNPTYENATMEQIAMQEKEQKKEKAAEKQQQRQEGAAKKKEEIPKTLELPDQHMANGCM